VKSKIISFISSLIPLLLLTGCTSVGAFFANVPTYFDDVQVTKNFVFNSDHKLKLDIFYPPKSVLEKKQILVFFYGGSWETGSKELYPFVGSIFAKQGYMVVIPDYRKYPDVKFPEFMFDAADAVEWTQNNFKKDKDIVLMGHSAGANIATLLITDKSYLKNKSVHIKAGIGLAGAYDFIPNTEKLEAIFAPPSSYPSMRPLTFVDGTEPPLFLGYGQKDEIVGQFNFDRMTAKLREKNVRLTAKLYPDLGHVDLISQLSWVGGQKSVLFQDISQFLNQLK
jgi:acetyl esterase/lipase